MLKKTTSQHAIIPIMWTITDEIIENQDVLERQFEDIKKSGFDGISAFVRCSRYNWSQKPTIEALEYINSLCKKNDIKFWVCPDPRFISRNLMQGSTGLPVVLFGDAIIAKKVPNFSQVKDDKFNIRCNIPPRHGHMVNEIAIEFTPSKLLKCYALPTNKSTFNQYEIIDITDDTNFFYNAKQHYVEAFGCFKSIDGNEWKVIAFFECFTCHVDFSNSIHIENYIDSLTYFAERTGKAELIMWDEPGYTCQYGALPYSDEICQQFKQETNLSFTDNIWKMAVECDDDSHNNIRIKYFQIIQQFVNNAQKKTWEVARNIWGPNTQSGIHDTWHFESADMCDMNHGSMDLWKGLKSKSGGFVDLGFINQLRDSTSDYYSNLAALCSICASLGKLSEDKVAYNNLWTVGDDETGWQKTVMNHCVNTMALFGQYWFAHIYGPVGTIGEEKGFLGSPPMPGYPDHSTWEMFPEWTSRLKNHFEKVEHTLPSSNILVVFPIETLYSLANKRADKVAFEIFNLILELVDNHYQVDIVSSSVFINGWWHEDAFVLEDNIYDAVIFPHAKIITESVIHIQQLGGGKSIYAFDLPQKTPENCLFSLPVKNKAKSNKEIIEWLDQQSHLKLVNAPKNSWISITKLEEGTLITLAPSRHDYTYEGEVSFSEKSMLLEKTSSLCRVFFPNNGTPFIL